MVHHQLKQLIHSYHENNNTLTTVMQAVLYDIYENLDLDTVNCLSDLDFIHTSGDKLAKPNRLFLEIVHEIPGWLFKINSRLLEMSLINYLGINPACQPNTYIELFKMIHDRKVEMSKELLDQIITIVIPYLCDFNFDFHPKDLYLPDADGRMCPSSTLCYKDQDWLPEDEHVNFLHESIRPEFRSKSSESNR